LEPNFDLFGLNVGENWALPNELLAANGAGFGTIMIEPFQGFDLLRRVPDILAIVHVNRILTILAGHCHHQNSTSQIPTKYIFATQLSPKEGLFSLQAPKFLSPDKIPDKTPPSGSFF
jgi:hypothetical protein